MTTFGDFEPDDAHGEGDLDPEATARIFLAILYSVALEGHDEENLLALGLARLIARLKREGTI